MARLGARSSPSKRPVTADALVRAYRKETERQKLLVKKETGTQSRLLFVVNALRRLFADEHFVTLLRAEGLLTIPRPILIAVTEIAPADGSTQVEFDWKWTPKETDMDLRRSVPKATASFDQARHGRASCRRVDNEWHCELGMWTTPADALGQL